MRLKIENLKKIFNDNIVIDGLSIVLDPGIYTITGASGCGKTTLARILCGLESFDEGEINTNGKKISCMFQEPRLFPWMNVIENITDVVSGCTEAHARNLLKALGLEDDIYKYPYELSVGMQRRVAAARTLSLDKCELYIFDEPLAGLDEERKITLCQLIKETVPRESVTIIISHDLNDVASISDSMFKLENGKLYFI